MGEEDRLRAGGRGQGCSGRGEQRYTDTALLLAIHSLFGKQVRILSHVHDLIDVSSLSVSHSMLKSMFNVGSNRYRLMLVILIQ